mgnify:FL=1
MSAYHDNIDKKKEYIRRIMQQFKISWLTPILANFLHVYKNDMQFLASPTEISLLNSFRNIERVITNTGKSDHNNRKSTFEANLKKTSDTNK